MKKKFISILITTILLLSVSFLALINENLSKVTADNNHRSAASLSAGLKLKKLPEYDLSIGYDWGKQKINVLATVNITVDDFSDSLLYFLLPANGLKSNKTLFALDKDFRNADLTSFNFSNIQINGERAIYSFVSNLHEFENDSTLIEIRLPKAENNNYKVKFKYSIVLPEGNYLLGYSKNKNFSMLNGFYPILLSENKSVDNFYSFNGLDLQAADYNVEINVDEKVSILNPELTKDNLQPIYKGVFHKKKNLVFLLKDDLLKYEHTQFNIDGQNINVWLSENNSKFADRIKKALLNSNSYLTKFLKFNSINSLLFVELPRSLKIKQIIASSVTGFHINLFAPIWKKEPEATIIKSYVLNLYEGNYQTEFKKHPWLQAGIPEFITDEIFHRYYGNLSQSFNLVSYLPVKGENMFSYDEIPIIYTLNSFDYEPWKDKISSYLKCKTKIPFENLPDNLFSKDLNYFVDVVKPTLALEIFKKYYGIENLKSIFHEFQNIFELTGSISPAEFNQAILTVLGKEGNELWNNLTLASGIIDIKIDDISRISESKYALLVSKTGNIKAPINLEVYTKNDTLRFDWNTNENVKQIFFNSSDDVIGAVVDPKNKLLFDENFANNSYFFSPNITTPLSFAIHWFFWVQNALMFFGVFG